MRESPRRPCLEQPSVGRGCGGGVTGGSAHGGRDPRLAPGARGSGLSARVGLGPNAVSRSPFCLAPSQAACLAVWGVEAGTEVVGLAHEGPAPRIGEVSF